MAETLTETAAWQVQIRDLPDGDWQPCIAMKGREVVAETRWNDNEDAAREQAAWMRATFHDAEVRIVRRLSRTEVVE